MLARREMAVALRTALARLRSLRLAPGHPPPGHKPSVLLRGLVDLHLQFQAAA